LAEELGRILVTGANGHLGRRLIQRFAVGPPRAAVRAVVRSEPAADRVREAACADDTEIVVVDYADERGVTDAAQGCDAAVHLVGILKEGGTSRYVDAHERATRALANAAAAAGLRRVVYLSILGATRDSDNACLASKGRAERILLDGTVPAVVLRVPMVLGSGDVASRVLARQATSSTVRLVDGGRSREQPIDADDVVAAIAAALTRNGLGSEALDLAGPESLAHHELVGRAAAILGGNPRIRTLPYALANLAAFALERVLTDPPLTRPMLGVLQHDDVVDVAPACRRLGIELTPLDETLRRCLDGAGDPA
jgi:NADH dehydrogenase